MLRAILFDFNGVLVDDEPLHLALLLKVLAEEGLRLDQEEAYERFLGLDDRACFAAALDAAGRDPHEPYLMRLLARKASYYQERIRCRGFPFFPGALRLVRQAAAASQTLGVVSGALRREVEGALRQESIGHLFKSIVAAEDVGEGKPSPEGYRRALEELNGLPPLPERLFHPHEVLAIEDSLRGIEAASAAGLVTLGVAHSYPQAELAADVVVASLADVTLEELQLQLAEASRA